MIIIEYIDKDKYNQLLDSMINSDKHQNNFEKIFPDNESLKHGKPTKKFREYCKTRLDKLLERKYGKKVEDKEPEFIDHTDDGIPLESNKITIDGDINEFEGESSAVRIQMPAVFKTTYNDFWVPIINKEIEMYKEGKPRTKGFLFLIDGKGKTGKTHFAQSAVEFEGYESKYRNVPQGYPIFVLEADSANRDEAETKWSEYLPSDKYPEGLIHIANCYVESPETEFVDPEATLKQFYAGMFSLKNQKQGTLIIDPFTMVCEYVVFVYMLKHTDKDGEFDITFDEFLKPSRKITITEYQYRKKLIYELLRKLRMFNLSVVLIGNVRPVYTEDKSIYKQKPTGQFETDVQRGTEYWVDVIGRFYKQTKKRLVTKEDGSKVTKDVIKRYLAVTDCRFEDAEIISDNYIFEAPTFSDVISYLMEVYPK